MIKEGVLVVGSANMDLVVKCTRFPLPGETIFGNKFQMFPGGKGANQAVSSAKLGMKTYFIGKLGNDELGKRLSDSMAKDGVDLTCLMTDEEEHTGTALITVDLNGQNQIIVISGSNMKLSPSDIRKNENIFGKIEVVLTQLEIPIDTVFETAIHTKENDAIFILNPAPACEIPNDIYPLIDYLTPNETELQMLSGMNVSDINSAEKAAKILIGKGAQNVIITLGEMGALLVNKYHTELYSTQKVAVVDTTAAGDSFNGALAYSLANDKELADAICFANKAASLSVTRMGAQSSMPVLAEIMAVK
jgi:ribokinase